MTILQAVLLGTLQGLTEFIPVSSSGHLVLAQHFMGLEHSASFDALINLGTFLALIVYFRKRIWGALVRVFKNGDMRLGRNLLISAIPVGIVGFLLTDFFESTFIQNPNVVVLMLISVGVLMLFLEKLPKLSLQQDAESLPAKRAWIIGFAQVVSLIPGTSRSASTMIAGRLMGLSYQKAAEYSFLLSIPVMAAVILKTTFFDADGVAFITNNFGAWLASNIAAFLFGLLAVSFMLKYLAKGNFKAFGYYRIALAAIIVIFLYL
jgi:undecaprenyl-diphosphatase